MIFIKIWIRQAILHLTWLSLFLSSNLITKCKMFKIAKQRDVHSMYITRKTKVEKNKKKRFEYTNTKLLYPFLMNLLNFVSTVFIAHKFSVFFSFFFSFLVYCTLYIHQKHNILLVMYKFRRIKKYCYRCWGWRELRGGIYVYNSKNHAYTVIIFFIQHTIHTENHRENRRKRDEF